MAAWSLASPCRPFASSLRCQDCTPSRRAFMQPIRGIILDVDGTLVNSNDAHARAWVEALAEQGRDVPFEKVRPLIVMGGDNLLPQAAGIDEDSPEGKKISKRRKEIFKKTCLPTLRPTPGVADLLRHLKSRGFRL